MDVVSTLDRFFAGEQTLAAGDLVVVAFSGGPDSTALAAGLATLGQRRGFRILAAHLDHALDPGSADRAVQAAGLAVQMGIAFVGERRPICRGPRETVEEAARRTRYAYLAEVGRSRGARWIATAHHRDDQAETVLLRIAAGSGLAGLAGIRPVVRLDATGPPVVRPFLEVPRSRLAAAVAERGLETLADPGNDDLARGRNRLRHRLLPLLTRESPDLASRSAALAAAAAGATERLGRWLVGRLDITATSDGAACDLSRLCALPPELLGPALDRLHRQAGAHHAPRRAARAELARHMRAGHALACDAGDGWRWRSKDGRLRVERRIGNPEGMTGGFSYTLRAPGAVSLSENGMVLRLARGPLEAWMFRGEPGRAGLDLPVLPGGTVTVRSRRPGDRLQPLGGPGTRRLKDLLIDRRLPASQRASLPLLCWGPEGDRIAWVPGIAIAEDCRLEAADAEGREVWIAELSPWYRGHEGSLESAPGSAGLVG